MLDRIPSPFYPTAAVALSLAGMFLLVGIGSPGPDGAADVPEAPLMEAERGPAASGDGTAEGIKVHGHWTIEVREPDGRLVTRREFENALLSEGAATLARVLGKELGIGGWEVFIEDASSSPCRSEPLRIRFWGCRIVESDLGSDPFDGENTFRTLTRSVDADSGVLLLSGEAAAQQDAQISLVSTFVHHSSEDSHFTSTSIDPIPVLDGQVILVTVRIGFS